VKTDDRIAILRGCTVVASPRQVATGETALVVQVTSPRLGTSAEAARELAQVVQDAINTFIAEHE